MKRFTMLSDEEFAKETNPKPIRIADMAGGALIKRMGEFDKKNEKKI